MMKNLTLAVVAALLLLAPVAHATNMLTNGDFETGALAPWYAENGQYQYPKGYPSYVVPWQISTFAHSGSYSAMDNGNIELRQDLGFEVNSNAVTELDAWIYDAVGGCGCNAFDIYFADGSFVSDAVSPTPGQWTYESMLFDVPANQLVTGFGIYGNDSGENCGACGAVYVDDIVLDPPPGAVFVPEPPSIALLGSALLMGAGIVQYRRRRRS